MKSFVFNNFQELVYTTYGGGDTYMANEYLNPKTVGKVIADYRKRSKLSQEVLSGLADICRTHLSAIERGDRKPTLETLYKICLALDVKMSDMIIDIEKQIKPKSVKHS